MDREDPRILTKEEQERIKMQGVEESSRTYQEKLQRRAKALTAQKIVDQAKSEGCWIYDPKDKIWYNPDEFLSNYEKFYIDHPLFKRVKIMSPKVGLSAGYKQLEMIQEKLKTFTQRVIEYYSKK
jgi:hypothetical protein